VFEALPLISLFCAMNLVAKATSLSHEYKDSLVFDALSSRDIETMTLALAKDNVELAAKNLKIRHSFTHIADTTELLSVVFAGFTSVLAFTLTAN